MIKIDHIGRLLNVPQPDGGNVMLTVYFLIGMMTMYALFYFRAYKCGHEVDESDLLCFLGLATPCIGCVGVLSLWLAFALRWQGALSLGWSFFSTAILIIFTILALVLFAAEMTEH